MIIDYNSPLIKKIEQNSSLLHTHFDPIIVEDRNLSRQIVSFQANKKAASFRWYKFKEAFSNSLVEYFILKYHLQESKILDPFAGTGTSLFTSSSFGCDSIGIELLPIGQNLIEARANGHYNMLRDFLPELKIILIEKPWKGGENRIELNEFGITLNAYPEDTKKSIELYLGYIKPLPIPLKKILELALLAVLEEISFTRKDGQYLRWDYRANRSYGSKKFDKGNIKPFDEAISSKLKDIIQDLSEIETELFPPLVNFKKGQIELIKGSCLNELPKLTSNSINAVITSPPYCNRYDYTRTYALELALLGISQAELSELRQSMLTCTVENREKDLIKLNPEWGKAIEAIKSVEMLQSILDYLEALKKSKELNNNGIVRMIKGYFYEMSCVIQEMYRVLTVGGYVIMVNDNVKYAGITIPVDLILSKAAENIGFTIENILVLPQKKGNSSQQMGEHGREELRKCVYIWKKY